MNNFIVYDFETSGRSSRFDQILQAGIIIYDQNLKVLNKLNLKSRINPDIVPSINALRVNKLKISDILSEKMSCYEMTMQMYGFLSKFQDSFFVGFNSINFDEEFFRQTLWEHFTFPYLTNTKGNSRLDVLNFVTLSICFSKFLTDAFIIAYLFDTQEAPLDHWTSHPIFLYHAFHDALIVKNFFIP